MVAASVLATHPLHSHDFNGLRASGGVTVCDHQHLATIHKR